MFNITVPICEVLEDVIRTQQFFYRSAIIFTSLLSYSICRCGVTKFESKKYVRCYAISFIARSLITHSSTPVKYAHGLALTIGYSMLCLSYFKLYFCTVFSSFPWVLLFDEAHLLSISNLTKFECLQKQLNRRSRTYGRCIQLKGNLFSTTMKPSRSTAFAIVKTRTRCGPLYPQQSIHTKISIRTQFSGVPKNLSRWPYESYVLHWLFRVYLT